MATVYADNVALNVDLQNRKSGINTTPRVNVVHRVYTLTGSEAAADIIRLVKLPAGTKILPHMSLITSDGAATTLTVDVGDDDTAGVGGAADADRYCDGADTAASGIDLFTAPAVAAAARTPYTLGADSWISATLATCATPVANKKLEFLIAYVGA